ncbi:hypothetical protein B4O97_08900 [Marispirochaeta aestuarii]|uniref:Uncharacterized protein n=1 Tax=Marispirochaeta aestuarii TaxID=1963862 RepID=A0A1Y1S0C3_9SPIO|nr:type II toxin-antitoxin system RelE/ParE family toxin [Marispirochaeta aestuarii]ORC35745.1 hypothetical protein B4O97_08900 [Marispirochaeta aestuarii]
MLTCTEEIYKDNFGFRVFGKENATTQVYEFMDREFGNEKYRKKLISVLNAINSNPMFYSHPEKFKPVEDDVWEIKIKPYRIACIWDSKPYNLVAVYGFKKDKRKWPKKDLENMRRQKTLYCNSRSKRIEGVYYGRNKRIEKRS